MKMLIFQKLAETEDNKDICETLRSGYKQALNHSLPYLQSTLEVIRAFEG